MSRNTMLALRLAAVVIAAACWPGGAVLAGPAPVAAVGFFDIDTLLMDHPLAADAAMRIDEIAHDSLSSVQLIQLRGVVQSHRHLTHEENIWIIRGAGRMDVDGVKHKVSAGQVIHIPKGISHSFYNMGSSPAVAISVFAPAFDGKDRILDNPPPR